MPRKRRIDYDGAWFHVFNRGTARRTVFETREDVSMFLMWLGEVVRMGFIEVHAFSVLTTHFHLLVRSLDAQLAAAMQRCQNLYVRWFNRTRRRDGPLLRGRYGAKVIESCTYWETVIRYIDLNPVHAGLATLPSDYEHGTAAAYRWGGGPDWLSRREVERSVGVGEGDGAFRAEAYDDFSTCVSLQLVRTLVERRMGQRHDGPDPLDDLVRAPSTRVQAWMRSKAALADGTAPGTVLVTPQTLLALAEREAPGARVEIGRSHRGRDALLRAGLLRTACGLRYDEIGRLLGLSPSTVHRHAADHQRALAASDGYARVAAEILQTALKQDVRPPARMFDLPLLSPAAAAAST